MPRLALVAVLILAGCSARPSAPAQALRGTRWLVDRIVEPDGSVRRGTGETVGFGADGRLSLSSCNLCSGPYTLTSSGLLTVSPAMTCTRRGCPEGVTELERELTGSMRTSRDGEYLVLAAVEGGRQIVLLPDPGVQPAPETR